MWTYDSRLGASQPRPLSKSLYPTSIRGIIVKYVYLHFVYELFIWNAHVAHGQI